LQPTTSNVEFNVDGLPPAETPEVEEACGKIADLVGRFCGGTTRVELLTRENPRIALSPQDVRRPRGSPGVGGDG
jgi:hypothetical protein